MKILQFIVTVFSLIISSLVNGQTFEKTFSGQWAETAWTFEFHKDGTFIRTSSGHFGNPIYKGTYRISADTVRMLNGFEHTSGTISEYYLLDKDSMLIDLTNFYDYSPNHRGWTYVSKKRYDILKKPNFDLPNRVTKSQLDTLVAESRNILAKKEASAITDEEHIQIIRLINTLRMSQDASLKSGVYAEFMNLVVKKNYEKEMASLYDWIPNRGMGFYFQKLQVELGGTPHLYSRYTVE